MTMWLQITPATGLSPVIHAAMIIQTPIAHMNQLGPYMGPGVVVNPTARAALRRV